MHQDNYTDISHLVNGLSHQPSPFFSYGGPEHEKIPPKSEPADEHSFEIHEVVEHEPDKEVQEYVEHRKDVVEVSPDLQEIGVTANTATSYPSYKSLKLPISDEKVMVGLKAPISSGLRWLAEFCIFLLKQVHVNLKVAHGKVLRVFNSGR